MEKEETINPDIENKDIPKDENGNNPNESKEEEISIEDQVKNLEDKLSRTLAEMENQRRRFEKERDDAFEYGGFSFAKEALNLIDNLERSKISLENDEDLKKNSLYEKISEHLDIIYNETL